MTAEKPNKYIFTLTEHLTEWLTVSKSQKVLWHWAGDLPIQRVVLLRDEVRKVDYLEYDRFQDGLWVGLFIKPCYPVTDLHHFYLGRLISKEDLFHGMCFIKGNMYAEYYSQDAIEAKAANAAKRLEIDWKKMSTARNLDFSNVVSAKCINPYSGSLSFACRLIPAPGSPSAQVSLSEDFEPETTLQFDSSFILKCNALEDVISEAKKIIDGTGITAEKASDFCENVQRAFWDYFPL